jgi:hypothetical protein
VARGEYYPAGRPDFDEFFIQLHRLQVEMLSAPEEPRAARAAMLQVLGLTPDASDESLRSRLDSEAKKLGASGARLRLEIPEPQRGADASATLHSEGGAVPRALGTLSSQATRVVRARERALAAGDQLERLRVAAIALEAQVDAAFRLEGPWKRAEVRLNLSDGQKLITVMLARSKDVIAYSERLLELVAKAATTDPELGKPAAVASVEEEPEPDEPPKAQRGRPLRPPGRSRPNAATTTRAPARPPAARAAPAAADARPPAPKPGTAPAEFEP